MKHCVKGGASNAYRSRLYREHKYVFFVFCDLIQCIGSLDFSEKGAIKKAADRLQALQSLLDSHADYEESRIHALLKKKKSLVCHEAEMQHQSHDAFFEKAHHMLSAIEKQDTQSDKNHLGYMLYLELRSFFAHNLLHFDYEEKIILPELQRLASDSEILDIDAQSYRQMDPDQVIHMMDILFPHMNADDRFTFLHDIKKCQPEKFDAVWQGIHPKIDATEKVKLIQSLSLKG
ncbi:MAG: hemerythrin domain-containing protein [Alphaproteobacteria bacterium]|nr:hemerythrin domain-containing protein [Alphaproteobacteria bacterium]